MTYVINDFLQLSKDKLFVRNNDTNKIFISYNNMLYEIHDIIFSNELLEDDTSIGTYRYHKGKMTKIIGSAYLYFTVEAKTLMEKTLGFYLDDKLSSSFATEIFNFLKY